jgi:hypothetical protein
MTKDEIMAMDADALRLAIAEAQGWKRIETASYFTAECWRDPDDLDFVYLPDWPADIAAAWELVEEMDKAYFSLTRTNDTHWAPAPFGKIHWECRFYAPQKGEMFGDTAPLAICRAWLVWKAATGERS